MRMPPPEALRDEEPPDDLLLVVRGGANSLSDAVLDRSTSVCWEKYEFFGVSVFAAPEDDLVALSEANLAIRRRRQVRTHVAALFVRQVFEVAATFTNPGHYSVVLPDTTSGSRRCGRVFRRPWTIPGSIANVDYYNGVCDRADCGTLGR